MDQRTVVHQTINMCRFCTKEFPSCEANPVRSGELKLPSESIDSDRSVVACDRYESPVEVLKTRFHD
ncbi:MAG: hypothetical protein G3M70_06335 [Candidatus Nitronauta litoralis]|uniref:Uncharacterized protein n=1 Tax=Candidatus Nitronauta litoralis TaxID=2705533 RepID=A0A7T0BV39_9BACT|nr:MAG: hypothetical protein G3M70_06335 [Candidatus Nitronauta litoralis]